MQNSGHISGLSLIGLLQVGCLFVFMFSMASFFDQLHWMIELLTHFKVQYLFLSLFFGVMFLLFKHKWFSMIAIFSVSINLSFIASAYVYDNDNIIDIKQGTLKLISYNVLSSNTLYSKLIEHIEREQPDIFLLQEVNKTWLNQLSDLENTYPYQINTPRHDNFGMALWSKYPIVSKKVHKWGKFKIPSIEAKLKFQETEFTLITTHPLPPVSKELSSERNAHLLKLTARVNQIQGPKIIMGDLNITAWSSHYQDLEKTTGLINARNGFGIIPTWPTNLAPFMIPIDHCLVSDHFYVNDIYSGDKIGSDHLPLIISVSLRSENFGTTTKNN